MKASRQNANPKPSGRNVIISNPNVLSEQELYLIRETAKLTENLYVKMVCDNLAMQKILRLM